MKFKDIDVRGIIEEENWNFVRTRARLKTITEPIHSKAALLAMFGGPLLGAFIGFLLQLLSGNLDDLGAAAMLGGIAGFAIGLVGSAAYVISGEMRLRIKLQKLAAQPKATAYR
ncbi:MULTISPECIES: hypothetical protein [Kordiimonas]|jgi:hypothetical protein|uniref:hypothetical protein n=1 Tax=Kordiimonas TaxID=288021 RepID=UPI00257E99A8|nr:hypothetical protein [Kordiimonas sp. UBA4487]